MCAVGDLRIRGATIGSTFPVDRILGGLPVVSLYIYPPEKRTRLVTKLMSLVLGGIAELRNAQSPPVVELEDGTSFLGMPVGIRNSGGVMSATFMDFATAQERQLELAEVADIVW